MVQFVFLDEHLMGFSGGLQSTMHINRNKHSRSKIWRNLNMVERDIYAWISLVNGICSRRVYIES